MLNNKYKVIISDIDGTLTPNIPNILPTQRVTEKIHQAKEQGFVFCLATGRPFSLIKYLIDHLGDIGPCITDNGAVIMNSKDCSVIWESLLSHGRASRILELLKPFKLVRASCDIDRLENPINIPELTKIRKVSVHNITIVEAEKIIEKVCSELKDVAGVKASSYERDDLVDVYFSNINATKQHAVLELSKILGINHKEIIGVGDGYNDFPLLMACGLKVAMGNAVKELKDIADYVAPTIEEDGLAHVIDKYCLEK